MDVIGFFTQARIVATFFGVGAGALIGRYLYPARERELLIAGGIFGYLCAEGFIQSPLCPTAVQVARVAQTSSAPKTEA